MVGFRLESTRLLIRGSRDVMIESGQVKEKPHQSSQDGSSIATPSCEKRSTSGEGFLT